MKSVQEYNKFFWDFVNNYDTSNSNILRKIIHSFSVAESCFKISCYLNLNASDRLLAYLVGLLHDIGRFEQWKTYQTYNDKLSIDHGELSYQILNNIDCSSLFDLKTEDVEILKDSIRFHTKKYTKSNERINLFNKIVKNADAYSNIITTANGAQPMTDLKDGSTPELVADFINMRPLWVCPLKTKLDRCLMLTACCYYVRYPFLRKEIIDGNYIDIMYNTFSVYLNKEDRTIYANAVESLKWKYVESINEPSNDSDF